MTDAAAAESDTHDGARTARCIELQHLFGCIII
jgi:hypothetical protein